MGKRFVNQIKKHFWRPFGTNKPSECVMIGDNLELDIKGAQNCGINTIWINPKKYMSDNIQTVSVEDIEKINEQLIESLG